MGLEASIATASLSDTLRERTASVHLTAERSGIISDILKRKAGRDGYVLLLRNILPAYENLEAGLEQRSHHPALSVFAQPALFRAKSVRNDLVQLAGADFESSLPFFDAGAQYAQCVARAADGDGMRLLSHAYVRYFGDLSGGQVLKKLLGQSMALPPEALTLYEFPDIADHRAFKDQMRAAIDRAPVSDPEELISEALTAFQHNIAVSDAVQGWVSSTGQKS
jgi:heme oxygenase